MKKTLIFTLALFVGIISNTLNAQNKTDSLGLPGDNLNLYSVLDIFQKSETLEIFEKKLNDEASKINNLDLDGDDKTDYIKVVDNMKGNAHAIVLQVAVNATENQDIAVIAVDKDTANNISIQIIGDELLYGKDYIVEPQEEKPSGTPNPGYKGEGTTVINNTTINNTTVNNTTNTTTNTGSAYVVPVATWGIFAFLFLPTYVVYSSPYYYGYYPPYWHPWAPVGFHVYYGYHPPYYGYHRGYGGYHSHNVNVIYAPHRSTSVTVNNRRQSGGYNNTYNRNNNGPNHNQQPSKNNNGSRQSGTKQPSQNNNTNRQPSNKQPSTSKPDNRTPSQTPARTPAPSNKPTRTTPSNNQRMPQSRPSGGGGGGGGRRR